MLLPLPARVSCAGRIQLLSHRIQIDYRRILQPSISGAAPVAPIGDCKREQPTKRRNRVICKHSLSSCFKTVACSGRDLLLKMRVSTRYIIIVKHLGNAAPPPLVCLLVRCFKWRSRMHPFLRFWIEAEKEQHLQFSAVL